MGDDAAAFDLEAQLERLSLDSDVYKGYIEGIMDDEDGGAVEERVASVLSFLGSATEEDLGGFGTELKKQYEIRHAAEAARAASLVDAGKAEERRRYEERLEEDKKAAQAEQERQAAELIERTQGDRATARGREALLNKYAFGDDVVDEDEIDSDDEYDSEDEEEEDEEEVAAQAARSAAARGEDSVRVDPICDVEFEGSMYRIVQLLDRVPLSAEEDGEGKWRLVSDPKTHLGLEKKAKK